VPVVYGHPAAAAQCSHRLEAAHRVRLALAYGAAPPDGVCLDPRHLLAVSLAVALEAVAQMSLRLILSIRAKGISV